MSTGFGTMQQLLNSPVVADGVVLVPEDISELESVLLGQAGLLRPVPFAAIKGFSQTQISYFCYKHAVYQIVTTELVDFVSTQIDGFNTIEIGSGNGCLGRALGIPLTDNKMQDREDVKGFYRRLDQPTISYPDDVQKIDALTAIKRKKADCAVGSWVTQKYKVGMREGNFLGVDGAILSKQLKRYVFVGNYDRAQQQEVLRYCTPVEYKFEWLVSRSMNRAANLIWVFDFV